MPITFRMSLNSKMLLLVELLRLCVLIMDFTFPRAWSTSQKVKDKSLSWLMSYHGGTNYFVPYSYSFTDYGLVNALTDTYYLHWIWLCYDIWCLYKINLLKQITEHFPASLETIKKITGAIPKMHVKNHVKLCQLLWAFDYILHSGSTHGEMIETGWVITNEAVGSTKEMNDGHRHDTLDNNLNYYNWKKFHWIGMFCGKFVYLY